MKVPKFDNICSFMHRINNEELWPIDHLYIYFGETTTPSCLSDLNMPLRDTAIIKNLFVWPYIVIFSIPFEVELS